MKHDEKQKNNNDVSTSKRILSFFTAFVLLFSLGISPLQTKAALYTSYAPVPTSQYSLDAYNQIASTDENGNYIFYAALKQDGATPFRIGPNYILSGDAANGYVWTKSADTLQEGHKIFYSEYSSPSFHLLKSNSADMDMDTLNTDIKISLYDLYMTKTPETGQTTSAKYFYEGTSNDYSITDMYGYTTIVDNSDMDVTANYEIVAGSTGKKDIMRYEYTITNKSPVVGGHNLYIGGLMIGDTMLTAGTSSVAYNKLDGDNALLVLDNPEPYVYSPTNTNGFIPPNGDTSKAMRFVDSPYNTTTINSIPKIWNTMLSFVPTNPASALYSVLPDKLDSITHFYPTPNVIDFIQYDGLYPNFISSEQQKSGQLAYGSLAEYGSGQLIGDSQTNIQWNKTKIAPGESVSFIYFIGFSEMNIVNLGILNYTVSVNPSRNFVPVGNSYDPIVLTVKMNNSSTVDKILDSKVKLYYDPEKIQPVDANKLPIAPSGSDPSITINGVTGTFPYILNTVGTILAKQNTSTSFSLVGINNTLEDVDTYVMPVIEYKNIFGEFYVKQADPEKLTVPGKIVSLYLNGEDGKIYKPSWASLTAHVQTSALVNTISSVSYVMLPTTDNRIINTEAAFVNAANSVAQPNYTGLMYQSAQDSTVYNVYNENDPSPNGISDNGNVWVMAKVALKDGSTETIFQKYTFKNIYTPVSLYHQGETSIIQDRNGSPANMVLYDRTLVELPNNEPYGLPLDLDGTLLTNDLPYGYDQVIVKPKDLAPLWACEEGEKAIDLKDIAFKEEANTTFTFHYNKNIDEWYDVTFVFTDENGDPLVDASFVPLLPASEIIEDLMPKGGFSDPSLTYLLRAWQYTPPDFSAEDYKPKGYSYTTSGSAVDIAFPIGYGDIEPQEGEIVYIMYQQQTFDVKESYHLFEGNVDQGLINPITYPDKTKIVAFNSSFEGTVPKLDGYVYRGYSVDGGLTYTDIVGYPDCPTDENFNENFNPYEDWKPTIPVVDDDKQIIYKYKKDTNRSNFADEDTRTFIVSGVGMDSHGVLTNEALYQEPTVSLPVGSTFHFPNPRGTNDNGNILFRDTNNDQWVLAPQSTGLNPARSPFVVEETTQNNAFKYFYYKDTSKNGVADFFEANVTIHFVNEKTNTAMATLNSIYLTEMNPQNNFEKTAPNVPGFIAVGYTLQKVGDSTPTPVYTEPDVPSVSIAPLNIYNYIITFLYQPDTNNNNIPDNVEANITIVSRYEHLDGHETTTTNVLVGRNGSTTTIDPQRYNDLPTKFQYVSASASLNCVFDALTPQTITLNFKEKETRTVTVNYVIDKTDTKIPNTSTSVFTQEPQDSFALTAQHIKGYVPVGYTMQKVGDSLPTPVYTDPIVPSITIEKMGDDSYLIAFLYQLDENNNNIPDNVEATITIVARFMHLDGHETTKTTILYGRNADAITIDPQAYNTLPATFGFANASASLQAVFDSANPQTITLKYVEKQRTIDDGEDDNGGGGGQTTPTTSPTATTTPTASPTASSTPTATSSPTVSSSPTASPTVSQTPMPTEQPTSSPVPSETPNDNRQNEREFLTEQDRANGYNAISMVDSNQKMKVDIQSGNATIVPDVLYYEEFDDSLVPLGFVKVSGIDNNGVEYWYLEEEPISLGKVNPKTGDHVTIPVPLTVLATIIVVVHFSKRKSFK